MGSVCTIFSDCFKKTELEKPILTFDVVYQDKNNLTSLSDLIDNNYVQWKNNFDSKSEIQYLQTINETLKLRKKYQGNAV